jgi:drug/metabolite transporter (DMT)-like permease
MAPFFIYNYQPLLLQQGILALGVGLFPGFLAILFAVMALRELPAATFGTLAYFEPLAVVVFGWFFFQESLSSLQLAGCAVILFSGSVKAITDRPV